jgi:hypothetical protein
MSDSGVTDGLTVDAPGEARMSTTISVLGGVGLFLLGMSVMTGGLNALAGSGLRTTLSKAAATPPSGTFWGDHDARERQAHAGVGRVHGSGCGLHFETASASSPNAGTTSKALVIPMVNSTLVGCALGVMAANVAITILYMVVYSHVINVAHEKAYYDAHVKIAAPYCSIVAATRTSVMLRDYTQRHG